MEPVLKTRCKPLFIVKILFEKTDEYNPITVNEIIEELKVYNISAERKSIYSDIKLLIDFGLDIICEKSKANLYYIGKREFELPELKILVDAVQSSRFITRKKSEELIKKITNLTSMHEAKILQEQVTLIKRPKSPNENIYYNIDGIYKAIQRRKQIKFKYFDFNLKKRIEYRRNGEWYCASPYALTWDDENYYMVAYYNRYQGVSNFRVDRMVDIRILEEDIFQAGAQLKFDLVEYTKKNFKMYSGETETVKIEFHNSLINVVLDRFGNDIQINKRGEECFSIIVNLLTTDTFLSWLFMFGDKVRILAPEALKKRMVENASKVMTMYL